MITIQVELPTPERVEINWMHGYANKPDVVVHVDEAWEFPSPYETWEHRPLDRDLKGTLYLATHGIWAHFVYDDTRPGETHHTQFRGACDGWLRLEDTNNRECKIHVASGWSSGADCVNNHLAPEDHLIDVTLRSPGKYSIGRAGLAIRKDALEPLLPAGVYLVNEPLRGPYYVASVKPDTYEKAPN